MQLQDFQLVLVISITLEQAVFHILQNNETLNWMPFCRDLVISVPAPDNQNWRNLRILRSDKFLVDAFLQVQFVLDAISPSTDARVRNDGGPPKMTSQKCLYCWL
jgi:hypothetical protein